MHKTKNATLLASATRTATATGSAVATGLSNNPIKGDQEGFSRHMQVFQTVGTVSGTTPTLDLTVQGSLDNSTWFTLTPSTPWVQVIASTNKQTRRYEGPIPPYVRAVATIDGTNPSYGTHVVTALLGG